MLTAFEYTWPLSWWWWIRRWWERRTRM